MLPTTPFLVQPPSPASMENEFPHSTRSLKRSSTSMHSGSAAHRALTPMSTRKRPLQTADHGQPSSKSTLGTFTILPESTSMEKAGASKRRRLSIVNPSSFTTHSKELNTDLPTPPTSSLQPTVSTIRLKIELTKDEQRSLKIRKALAERWKPKLQRPFPARKEINEAYNLKLMRHYPNQATPPAPNFIKPHIDRSARVESLLRHFPVLLTSFPLTAQTSGTNGYTPLVTPTQAEIFEFEQQKMSLKANKRATRSEHAQRLAWKSFSSREKDRIDRGREAMMQSGLWDDDLQKESVGRPNELPEWKKRHTGNFARERRREQALHRHNPKYNEEGQWRCRVRWFDAAAY